MAISKRAMFFTLMSLLFVLVIIAFFMPNSDKASYMDEVPSIKMRVSKSANFVNSMYGELGERALRYSGHNAVLHLIDVIDDTRSEISNPEQEIMSLMMNGTRFQDSNKVESMKNRTIVEIMERFRRLGEEELDLHSNLTVDYVEAFQDYSTGAEYVGLEMGLTLQMDAGEAKWNTSKVVQVMLSIEKYDDPYYILNWDGYRNRIRFTNISDDGWDGEGNNVFYFIDEMRYNHVVPGHIAGFHNGPSFLMRFENKSSESECCGMESLINPLELNIRDDIILSYVDYCFFGREGESCGDAGSLYGFVHLTNTSMDDRYYAFKLDTGHINVYNLSKDIIS